MSEEVIRYGAGGVPYVEKKPAPKKEEVKPEPKKVEKKAEEKVVKKDKVVL